MLRNQTTNLHNSEFGPISHATAITKRPTAKKRPDSRHGSAAELGERVRLGDAGDVNQARQD
jgi:hypothetical protein